MLSLSIHEDAVIDLRALKVSYPKAMAKILATLEQIQADPNLIDKLTEDRFGEDEDELISIRRWVSQWVLGDNLWRMKIWGLEENGLRFRILYAYEPRQLRFHVLAVVRRADFNYEPDHPITKRILATYRKLGITTH